MKNKMLIIAISTVSLLLLIQLIRVDNTNPASNIDNDFLVVSGAPKEISDILKNSCYDCHSNQTVYPWYSEIAPVSWMLHNHISEGRSHVNFSNFGEYSLEHRNAIKYECIEEIEEGEMPLFSYTLIHANARLTGDSKQLLIDFLKQSSPIE